ncbi:hemerythrin domain-containing protein [Aequorivita todarodis]|uniref:hemerythrin domain-containing protein n=1 Tax=Aequorivita todarodis TaxID=2036821 RepID=UPI0023507012|nr:hemerythrin domain-containing protein [Aequorivita todarodis]MDC8001827.1 hemerythrin domain-containing protein [Aequorivita todarodis]
MKKKNHKANLKLTPLIEEHDEVVLFCERIREGLRHQVDDQRIKAYVDWFKTTYLNPHFEMEQTLVFPILGDQNVRVRRAMANHRRLERLFAKDTDIHKTLHKIEEELTSYIGFEERILYNEIRGLASPGQWQEIENGHHQLPFNDAEWKDRFWEDLDP